jgi:hypothetical protein
MLHIYACLQVYVSSVSGVSNVSLQLFHVDVAYVCNGFQVFLDIFTQVFLSGL